MTETVTIYDPKEIYDSVVALILAKGLNLGDYNLVINDQVVEKTKLGKGQETVVYTAPVKLDKKAS